MLLLIYFFENAASIVQVVVAKGVGNIRKSLNKTTLVISFISLYWNIYYWFVFQIKIRLVILSKQILLKSYLHVELSMYLLSVLYVVTYNVIHYICWHYISDDITMKVPTINRRSRKRHWKVIKWLRDDRGRLIRLVSPAEVLDNDIIMLDVQTVQRNLSLRYEII